jgi:hypothetical protein
MPSAAKGSVTSTWVRWVRAATGMWHAYSLEWHPTDEDPGRILPMCKRPIPRNRLGRESSPPTSDDVCRECSVSVGFRRRPAQARYMATKVGKADRLLSLEAKIEALEARVEALERKGKKK